MTATTIGQLPRWNLAARRLATSRLALLVVGLELLLIAAGVPLSARTHQLTLSGYGLGGIVGISFTAVGFVVAYRRPDQPMGWIMLAVGGLWALSSTGGSYVVLDYRFDHGHDPLGGLGVLAQLSWAPSLMMLVLAVILFPDGHPPSTRWRWPVRWLGAITIVWAVVVSVIAIHAIVTGTVHVESNADLYQVDHSKVANIAAVLVFLTWPALIVSWLVSAVSGYRHLSGERRVQQKWIASGVAVTLVMIAASAALGNSTVSDFTGFGITALPVAMGVGILRYRLYEIDRLVSRTLSYAVLSALLVGVFVGLVALTTDVLPFSSSVGVAASTLAAAALFNPLRGRVPRVVDRRFNRARYDAEATVAAFAARLRDAVDLHAVQAELLEVVQRTVQPEHATIWIRAAHDRPTPPGEA
jgi:uncharacterized protein (DUF2237 family)